MLCPVELSEPVKVACVLFNLDADFRAHVRLDPTTCLDWRSLDALEKYISSIHALNKPLRDADKAPFKFNAPRGKWSSNPNAKRFSKWTKGSASGDIIRSFPAKRKREFAPNTCIGCGNSNHLIGDEISPGVPVCPKFNPAKHFLRSQKPLNGKGKK